MLLFLKKANTVKCLCLLRLVSRFTPTSNLVCESLWELLMVEACWRQAIWRCRICKSWYFLTGYDVWGWVGFQITFVWGPLVQLVFILPSMRAPFWRFIYFPWYFDNNLALFYTFTIAVVFLKLMLLQWATNHANAFISGRCMNHDFLCRIFTHSLCLFGGLEMSEYFKVGFIDWYLPWNNKHNIFIVWLSVKFRARDCSG